MRIFCSALLMLGTAAAQLPGVEVEYSEDVPTLAEVAGHEPGLEITKPEDALDYMRRLRRASPDRMRLYRYAESWEGRPLVYGMISSEENIARLDEIKEGMARLASGTLSDDKRDELIADLPAITWLSYGVHGNEISSTDAGLQVAYHLLAAEGDADVERILAETVVIIDPVQNPDGRARFTHHFEQARGLAVQGDRYSAERDEEWPGGRFNHYLFDMNRDWFTLSQPETRGKVQAVAEWNPVVFVDAHEMGSDSSYYFPPAARPYNPQLSERSREGQAIIGRMIADVFDEEGTDYFTREVFDNLYPGYGDMWPGLRGAVAMTFEQSSARGLKHDRADGSELTYQDGVKNHFLATLTTARAVAENKERFLSAMAEDRATAIEMNEGAEDRYAVIDRRIRPAQADRLAEKLQMQGIEVQMAEPGSNICGTNYEEGAIVVDKAQPDGRLVRTLLDPDTPMAEDFIAAQEDRRSRGLPHELYDVTAWSMPLMDGVTFTSCRRVDEDALEVFAMPEGDDQLLRAGYGYVLPWEGAGQARLLVAALAAGLDGRVTIEPFVQNERKFPRGSVVFPNGSNPDDMRSTLVSLRQEHGGELVPMETSWVEEGPNVGSGSFTALDMPKVAMAWGEGTSPLSVGSARYVMERRLGVPVTPIRVRSMGRADLSAYDVLVVPEIRGSFGQMLGSGGTRAVKAFAEDGGVLIGFGSALDVLTSEDAGLLPLRRENKVGEEPSGSSDSPAAGTELWSEEDYEKAIAGAPGRPDYVPGVLLSTDANEDSLLSAGYEEATVLFRGNTIYAPLRRDEGTNVFTYKGADDVLASGYLWDDVRTQIGRKPFLVSARAGDGMVIGFTQDPTTRAYLGGLDLMLANALLLAPSQVD
ncbi:M14 family metallopeptidase [Parvularcula maris]|uniref:M14 family metallopeptidase n=1 Tax=Parvularcula maris TaxID=2965077 RepID=A0A9X2RI48_9PROT|nr:M14 family metallopeptidase [Parvularcula maris]MCQ8184576.1 M14 family metallopeptidase [Parvularcula maris]